MTDVSRDPVVIRIDQLSKQFQLGERRQRRNLRDTIQNILTSPFRTKKQPRSRVQCDATDTIWAVKDLSLDIRRGEVLGVIGRNGAGKSTLLKILSRITTPTTGGVDIYGRVGSLLEVGTGFHPELSGRENVYLNGAILGMSKVEIDRKLDEIIAFAEVEKFVDTPVKHYSSGMYVRLAFSVAAHLEPDILLVDEALAVGDARFIAKSVEKMRSLNAAGMTIVLVTHQIWYVQTFCTRAICMEQGGVVAEGAPLKVIGAYRDMNVADLRSHGNDEKVERLEDAKIHYFSICPDSHAFSKESSQTESGAVPRLMPQSGLRSTMEVEVYGHVKVKFFMRVTSPDGFPYFTVYSDIVDYQSGSLVEYDACIPSLMLLPGDYHLWSGVCSGVDDEVILSEKYLPFQVYGDTPLADSRRSVFWNQASWTLKAVNNGHIADVARHAP